MGGGAIAVSSVQYRAPIKTSHSSLSSSIEKIKFVIKKTDSFRSAIIHQRVFTLEPFAFIVTGGEKLMTRCHAGDPPSVNHLPPLGQTVAFEGRSSSNKPHGLQPARSFIHLFMTFFVLFPLPRGNARTLQVCVANLRGGP